MEMENKTVRRGVPAVAQWVRHYQLQLRSDPWPGNSICHQAARRRKQTKNCKKSTQKNIFVILAYKDFFAMTPKIQFIIFKIIHKAFL